MEKEKLLEVRNLRTYFTTDEGLSKAVDGISFTIHKGETVGIVGESGSGKSVTCLTAMQLIPQPPGFIESGEILYHRGGEIIDLVKLPEHEMRQYRGNEMAMIFQEPMTSLNPVFTCGEQVAETIVLHKKVSVQEARLQTLALFERVKLPTPQRMYDSYPHQLSGGQKQRVMIAMALSCSPTLLIADEPTTALDVTVQKTILELIDELRTQIQTSVVFITHDLGVIAEVADRVIVMYKGKIVEDGKVLDIFSNPQHAYTKSLLACRPPLDLRMSKLPTVDDFMTVREEGGEKVIEQIPNTSVKAMVDKFYIKPEVTRERMQMLLTERPTQLKVDNLKVWFPSKKNFFGKTLDYVRAVDDISFEVKKGETLGLVGESGCGKTTTGRAILQLAPITGGRVLFDGKNVQDSTQQELLALKRRMQIIFQDPYSSLNPRMPIGKAIMEPMIVHGLLANDDERKAKVLELLRTVKLEERHFSRYPHEFSGGQRQRICIARALALEPEFIICDESVSALDVSVQAQVLNLLIELRETRNFTYIFISHDLSVVKFMSDRMVVMNKGKIVEQGVADEIYENPKEEYTQRLISAIPKGRVEDIKNRLQLV